MNTKIAAIRPAYEGTPEINAPGVYGASPGKPFLWLLPVTGERPMRFSANELPDGLTLDSNTGIVSGTAISSGEYDVVFGAENALGVDSKKVKLIIKEGCVLLTPLLGFTSWNAYRNKMTQTDIENTARLMVTSGLSAHGYSYVNIDSGWQGEYGGDFGAIQSNANFPDMRGLCDTVHSLGLKAGIYSTPMQRAWGGGEYPGCTRGKLDRRYPDAHFGIGEKHCEAENVHQWTEWQFDYLKYDWSPCDTENAERMKAELRKCGRDFGFCVTVHAGMRDAEYWKANCSSWRDNSDSRDEWSNLLSRFNYDGWTAHSGQGHYFDLDMLEMGFQNGTPCRLSEDEQLIAFTVRALFPSPIQISAQLDKLTDFELFVLLNDEVLRVNQDSLGAGAVCVAENRTADMERRREAYTNVYVRPLSDGSFAVGFFNLGETAEKISYKVRKGTAVRDLWAREDIEIKGTSLTAFLPSHSVRLFRIKQNREN